MGLLPNQRNFVHRANVYVLLTICNHMVKLRRTFEAGDHYSCLWPGTTWFNKSLVIAFFRTNDHYLYTFPTPSPNLKARIQGFWAP